jgi:threonine dehydratase
VGIQTIADSADRNSLLEKLSKHYDIVDLSDNEVAVLHVRHMIGGRVSQLEDERLFRVEFPERPGALGEFLDAVGSVFNISTFHYRNHGSAYGRVLVGMQVPESELAAFRARLKEIGYRHWEETENPAYRLFLR